ncbi:MAG: crosslink repair DNA glycosylase YcaQ family protein [Chloroflexota bacterium]
MIQQISQQTRRRYILGRQGLWPGRRWTGREGVAQALQTVEAVQIDPVSIVSPSADIVLWGRVAAYNSDYLSQLIEQERRFFDYGGGLMIYPMIELPYWRVVMARKKSEKRWSEFFADNTALINTVREEVRQRGPVRNRDMKGETVNHYRGSKDTSVALYYLWLTGELMTARREGKERVYDFLENVAPAHLQHTATDAEAEVFFACKAISHLGFVTARSFRNTWKGYIERPVTAQEANAKLAELQETGLVSSVRVEDAREQHYFRQEDEGILNELEAGQVPAQWQPIGTTTLDEVTFFSPLEFVSARGRAAKLFGFDYIWEIYKPAAKRKYGPYTLPILYGDQLVGRMDAKLERQEATLRVNGLWLEDWFDVDERFQQALDVGLNNFMHFLQAEQVNMDAIN